MWRKESGRTLSSANGGAQIWAASAKTIKSECPEEPGSSPEVEDSWQAPELRRQHGLWERCQGWARAKSNWEQGPEALRLAKAQARNLNPLLCREGEERAHLLWFQWLDRASLRAGGL